VRRLIAFLLFIAPLAAYADRNVAIGPTPSWVERLPIDTNVAIPARDIRGGIYAILTDHQAKAASADYFRSVRKVLTPSAVQNASEISFDFDPSYEQLIVHDVSIIRGGETRHALDPAAIRVIEKEDDAHDRIYDGLLTAIIFLRDVRPGDVLDYSWSLVGANPLLGEKYADTLDVSSDVPARLIRHKLIWPASRKLRYRSTVRGLEPSVAAEGGGATLAYTWERRDVAASDVEDDLPDWFDPYDHVELTEFSSWADVAKWADALFQLDDESRDAVRALAARIRSENASRDAQITAAIRFVQDDIRYLGIEMGRNSHEPHQPGEVLDQRWGDCKDKSFLLASLLRELGVEAYPAMVNTKMRHSLDDELPSPFNFDHVIDEVIDNGKVRWIDPTLAEQGGTLDTIETPNDERALVINAGTTSLAKIVTNQKGGTSIERTFTSATWDGPTTLVVRSTYSGGDADAMRSDLASQSIADVAKERVNRLAADVPKIKSEGPLAVSDDRAKNVIAVTARYTIRDLWKSGEWSYTARAIEHYLARPETSLRSMPLSIEYPLNVTETTTFHLPSPLSVDAEDSAVDDAAFHFESHVTRDGNAITLRHVLRATRDSVSAAGVPEHLTKLNAISDQLGAKLSRKSPTASLASVVGGPAQILVAFAVAIVFGFLLLKRRKTEINV